MSKALTQEQRSKVVEYKEKWLSVGLSTERADRKQAEHWAKEAYKIADLTPPSKIEWAESPSDAIKVIQKHDPSLSSKEISSCFLHGNHSAGWLGFYEFFKNELHVEACNRMLPLIELAKVCGWWSAYDELIVLQERPIEIHRRDKKLHKDMGPAVLYADGFGVYALDGIRIKKEYAMTPANEFDCKVLLKEQDVDVRRVLIEKVGLEKLITDLGGTVIDKDETYELLLLDLGDNRQRPFLKMKNPSIDAIHVEGVPPGTTKIVDALAYRNGFDLGSWTPPEVLT